MIKDVRYVFHLTYFLNEILLTFFPMEFRVNSLCHLRKKSLSLSIIFFQLIRNRLDSCNLLRLGCAFVCPKGSTNCYTRASVNQEKKQQDFCAITSLGMTKMGVFLDTFEFCYQFQHFNSNKVRIFPFKNRVVFQIQKGKDNTWKNQNFPRKKISVKYFRNT